MEQKGLLVIVSGFSGVGKGTMMKMLVDKYDEYALSVSATTRAPRENEKDGINYFFVTKEEFREKFSNNEFLEYAEYVGNYYGTPKAFVESKINQGKNVLLEIEVQGAKKVKEAMPEAVTVFIMPPSAGELKERLIGRGTETAEVIEMRLKRAVEESKGIDDYEFIIVNDDLEKSVDELHSLISMNKRRTISNREFINEIKNDVKRFAEGD